MECCSILRLRHRRNLTPISNVCEIAPTFLFLAPNGLAELPKMRMRSQFSFNLIGKLTMAFLSGQSWQFMFLHRRIATNDFLFKIGLKQADSCSFCGEFTETLAFYLKHVYTRNQPQPSRENVRRSQIDEYNDRNRFKLFRISIHV